jgi:hypothetical protein
MKITIALVLLFSASVSFACKKQSLDPKEECLDIHHKYLAEAFRLTQNCVGFSAPVSGRAYGYFSVGMYEATLGLTPDLKSLEGQLNGYKRMSNEAGSEDLNWMIVVNSADYQLLSYYYRNMPPSSRKRLDNVHDSIHKVYSKKCPKKMRMLSEQYAMKIVEGVIDWSKTDGADDGFDRNFPEDYEPPVCEPCWTRTFPGFLDALVPYWGSNRPMMINSPDVAGDMEIFPYDTVPGSVMWEQAMGVLNNSKETDPKYELLAEYWDDAAGYSGTPSGHFFTLARGFAISQDLDLDDAMELYVKLGVAVNEAFISAFYLKYKFNFIRPITYIQRYIDPQFNTRLASPPFPEYPSGHSFQSGAATEVMKSVFGDQLKIVDSTNYGRTDIDGTPRTYNSFTEMSEEISISRLYGGIHFRKTLDNSLAEGRKIGQYVARELKCRK